MASTHQPPIMVDQPSSPPIHTFSDYGLSILSASSSNQRTSPASAATTSMADSPGREESTQPHNHQDTPSEVPATEQPNASEAAHDGDDSSNSESQSESSTSTETPGTISTPRSAAQDSGHAIPESSSTRLEDQPLQETPIVDINTSGEQPAESNQHPEPASPNDTSAIPPQPMAIDMPTTENIPSWVQYEEDTSVPDQSELKEIEARSTELNASDTVNIEKEVFPDLDDPDLRPCKKIRLSWVVKGVRGTKERPNRSRIMTSPAVCVDGNYWNIKFFPRGNKNRSSLATYLRCSPVEPLPNKSDVVGSFKCYEGAPDTDLSTCDPVLDLELTLPDVKESGDPPAISEVTEEKIEEGSEQGREDERDADDESISGDEDEHPATLSKVATAMDYRVSAQLGLVIYNPAEPRTCFMSSATHQFYPHQDDWGWDTAVSRWEDIHRRRKGQRQALLRDDTLAIDAYIRIYDDPTKALFWHSSSGETQWDSKGLAGVYPMGTRLLYHSPATAGIVAWAMLAPFRSAIQRIDAGAWRKESSAKPRPLVAYLQLMLFQMRNMKKEENYVHLDNVIHEITRSGESFDNVKTFWEAFRRSIEVETEGDAETRNSFNALFGTRAQSQEVPLLPIHDVANFQDSATAAFKKVGFNGPLPDFLPLSLERQTFDSEKRQWRLHHDRVKISEEIDLSEFCTQPDGKYSLYGLVIHDGDRTSGKFFSVLRPHGPAGKWLAFSDGNGNKVFSYTKKRIEEYEGLSEPELKRITSTRQTIHTALYIRTSCLVDYLPAELEPYRLPSWLKPHLDETYHQGLDIFEISEEADTEKPISIELIWDKSVSGQEGKLDLFKLKTSDKARRPEHCQQFSADKDATILEVKIQLASTLDVDQKAFKLWAMNYHRLGGVSKGYMYVLPESSLVKSCLNTSNYLGLWFTMSRQEHDLEEEILAKNFTKISGMHIQAVSKPEPVLQALSEDQSILAILEANAPVITGSTSHGPIEAPTDGVAYADEAGPDAEQASVREAVDQTVHQTSIPLSLLTSEHGGRAAVEVLTNANTALQESSIAAADVEQTSVQDAVEQSVMNAASTLATATTEVTEIEPSDIASLANPSSTDIPSEIPSGNSNTVGTAPLGNIAGTASASQSVTLQAVTPPESVESPSMLEDQVLQVSESTTVEGMLPAVVHGHLFEALSHDEAPLSHGQPPLPVGIPFPIGDNQIMLVQPGGQEDISAEDAALITSMIAADLVADERARRRALDADAADEDAESNAEDEVNESRPPTPRQRIVDVYGFLHVFDAVDQKFTAHSTFMVPRDTTISTMVRKQMRFDEEKSFHLWKRDGTYRTVGVSLESTFQDCSLTDCCEVIVGDHLGELKMESLKAEAKFVDPGQLIRYMAMVQRGHLLPTLTSEDAVEVAEFGGDYYKGPFVRGQRHGKECRLITQSGDCYEGPLVAGQKSGGKGRMTYQNGDVYDGEWLDDQKHGQGEFVEMRTGNRYVGGYENDKRWGKGVTYWEQADQQAALCQVCYFEEVDALFYRCGHVVACYACARQCASDSSGCPVCRKPVEAVVKMYRS